MDNHHFLVKKLGGENASELSKSALNILDDYKKGIKQTVIVSAIRSPEFNTTDKLIQIGNLLASKIINKKTILDLIQELEDFHLKIVNNKFLGQNGNIINLIIEEFLLLRNNIEYYINLSIKILIPSSSNDYSINIGIDQILPIIGFGETISCKIFSKALNENSINATSINLSYLVNIGDLNGKNEKDIFTLLSVKISKLVEENTKNGIIPILSGYIGIFENGIEDTIGRGYSDATAAITSVGLAKNNSVILEIQKSVKGLLSADPRMLSNPKDAVLIKKLNYLTAREITGDNGAQAKLLHYQTLRSEVQEAGIKIHLFDPFSTDNDGSWIDDSENICDINNSIEFIGGRKNIVFFSISSGKMFEKGLLTRLFSIVDDYFSVDIVSTSETEVTFTIDGKYCSVEILDEMTKKIKKEFCMLENTFMEFVQYTPNKALIFCVGQHIRNRIGIMTNATKALSDNSINIELISLGRLQRSIVFGIDENDMKKAINVLHNTFITK